MSAKHPVNLQYVWPVEALDTIIRNPMQRSSLMLVVESVADFKQRILVSGLASRLVQNGVKLFALVGKEAEQAHDALDIILLETGGDDVLTSWHDADDLEEIAIFIVAHSRLNSLVRLIVVVNEYEEFGVKMKEAINEAIRLASNI